MADNKKKLPDYVFEVSWEVCNMVGGIHTVLSTKAAEMVKTYGDRYIAVGPSLAFSTTQGYEFLEKIWDEDLFDSLREGGFRVRMGHWQVPGNPRCLLIDFNPVYSHMDDVLREYWEQFHLNSLFGGPDYREPIAFGHAVGQVIEHYFNRFLLPKELRAAVQVHEWMCGSAALYLRSRVPEIASIFTTHATMLGRTLFSELKDADLHSKLMSLNAEQEAQTRGISSKHSMEVVMGQVADCYTTVSEVTALECRYLLSRTVDLVLPNGLAGPRPRGNTTARARLLEIAEAVTGAKYDHKKVRLLFSSGRYEFVNKGIDILLHSLADLRQQLSRTAEPEVVCFITCPADHLAPVAEVFERMQGKKHGGSPYISTHELRHPEWDSVLQTCAKYGFTNKLGNPVHVVFAPLYLHGKDPMIPDRYQELLSGADLTVFPSLYEPWGYTPLEAVATGIPTVSSDLAGFGQWALSEGDFAKSGVHVLKRKGKTFEASAKELTDVLSKYMRLSGHDREELRDAAKRTATKATWDKFAQYYFRAHEMAVEKASHRVQSAASSHAKNYSRGQVIYLASSPGNPIHISRFRAINEPGGYLKKFLEQERKDVSWSWDPDVLSEVATLDPALWERNSENLKKYVQELDPTKFESLEASPRFKSILEARTNAPQKNPAETVRVAYFCMEFGITPSMKIYSGGLGILAGDHLKAANDEKVPLCAVGLFYRTGYFRQSLDAFGRQQHLPDLLDPSTLPMEPVNRPGTNERVKFNVEFGSENVAVQAWRMNVGQVPLYLIDANLEENAAHLRALTDSLYSGGTDHRLKQEVLLGFAGHELFKHLGIKPAVYHLNEGHCPFSTVARMADLMTEKKLTFVEALEFVRAASIFTTHTPIPAGHDSFEEAAVAEYLGPIAIRTGTPINDWLALGRGDLSRHSTRFSMSILALKTSKRVNGVSKIHGGVTREMFQELYPGTIRSEIPIDSVTNGAHVGTWLAPEWQKVFSQNLDKKWHEKLADTDFWKSAENLDTQIVWDTHASLKRRLLTWLRDTVIRDSQAKGESSAQIAAKTRLLDPNSDTMVMSFAKRFVPYKRPDLLIRDRAKMLRLLEKFPQVLFVFAGKAHPRDGLGQDMVRKMAEIAKDPQFVGRILFLENYEITMAKRLVSGSDVWLNFPTRPLEACGTSGMKAAFNGGLNLSVPDGWWAEICNGRNGWALAFDLPSLSQETQDAFDEQQLFRLLEEEVIPLYLKRNSRGVPEDWVHRMKHAMATVIPNFSAQRMILEYQERFYRPSEKEATELMAQDYRSLRERVASMRKLEEVWKDIAFEQVKTPALSTRLNRSEAIPVEVSVKHPGVSRGDIRVQAVVLSDRSFGEPEIIAMSDLEPASSDTLNDGSNQSSKWKAEIRVDRTGQQALGFRVVPAERLRSVAGPMNAFSKWL